MNSLKSVKSVFVLALTLSATWSGTAFGREGVESTMPTPPSQAPQQQVGQQPTDLLDLTTEVLLMKIAPLLGNRSELHSLACTSQGFLYKLHMRPGHERHSWFEGVVQSLPGFRKTKTGAVYTKVLNHPKLGTAWKDPRGLLWSDQYMRGPDGEILQMNFSDAREHCFNLNGDRKAEVVRAFVAHEAQMRALRVEYYDARALDERSRLSEALVALSQRQPELAGCYLPTREELISHGLDLGHSPYPNGFAPQIFSEYDSRLIWSGSTLHNDFHRFRAFDAFRFDGSDGLVFKGDERSSLAFRCVCGAAVAR